MIELALALLLASTPAPTDTPSNDEFTQPSKLEVNVTGQDDHKTVVTFMLPSPQDVLPFVEEIYTLRESAGEEAKKNFEAHKAEVYKDLTIQVVRGCVPKTIWVMSVVGMREVGLNVDQTLKAAEQIGEQANFPTYLHADYQRVVRQWYRSKGQDPQEFIRTEFYECVRVGF